MKIAERKPIRIWLADGQPAQLESLRSYIGAQTDFTLVGLSTEGSFLLEALKNGVSVDIVVLDMVLQGRSSLQVLQSLAALHLAHKPRVLLTTCSTDPVIQQRYMSAGADMVVVKPYLTADLLEVGRLLCYDETTYRARRVEELAHIHLERMCAPQSANGYWYALAALRRLTLGNGPYNVCKELYVQVAEEMQVSPHAVESGIRRLVEAIHACGSAEYCEMQEYLGMKNQNQVTNNDFLSRLAQVLRLELQG